MMGNERLTIGSTDGTTDTPLGTIELDAVTGEIRIASAASEDARVALARLLDSMYSDRYADEAALWRSLPARLNNGYMWTRLEVAEGPPADSP